MKLYEAKMGKLALGLAITLLIVGCFVFPRVEPLRKWAGISDPYSLAFGLLLASSCMTALLLVPYFSGNVTFDKRIHTYSVRLLPLFLIPSVFFLPLLFKTQDAIAVAHAFLTACAGCFVCILGLNTRKEGEDPKDGTIRFLTLLVTLTSLASIVVSVISSNSDYFKDMPSFYHRSIFLSYYLLLPVTIYALGWMSKLLDKRMEEMTLVVSAIIGFFFGLVVSPVLVYNTLLLYATIPSFFAEGLVLSYFQRKKE